MNKFFKILILSIFLFLFWIILNESLNKTTILYGLGLSIIISFFTIDLVFFSEEKNYITINPITISYFIIIVFVDIIKSTYTQIIRIINNESKVRKVRVKLKFKNIYAKVLISNAITLTPGTISLEIEENIISVLCFAENIKSEKKIVDDIERLQKPFTLFEK
ncbi:Na+/H+ antiporter subunit E [Helicovermis profundi]|uniref:Uncharacterized protein n=1 Tax=Helicovermis profundi TaxID=3065157 RepID=A0AAU9ESU1_9FIRM|nr:hypothetical protein HLPR_04460 [Clostridia bacterium S502]